MTDAGLNDDISAAGEELNLSDQIFPEFVSDYVMPGDEFDFGMKPFAFPKDDGPGSFFAESEILGGALILSDHGAGDDSSWESLQSTEQSLMSPFRQS